VPQVRSFQRQVTRRWNFSTTLYFKGARLQPWQLADVRPRVCYVGLVFKEDPSPRQASDACCAAQMFLNSGNGVVFRGALFASANGTVCQIKCQLLQRTIMLAPNCSGSGAVPVNPAGTCDA
jgi:hypothetical protein